MEWLKIVLPLVGVIIGWLLAESGKIFSDRKQNKRKLRKLLFYLLELRFRFTRELSSEKSTDKYLEMLRQKLLEMGINITDSEFSDGNALLKPMIKQLVEKIKQENGNFEDLSVSIDTILNDLSEVDPFLAYELSGQHNIKARLQGANNYISEVEALEKQIPFDIGNVIHPRLTKELLSELDESINKIAGRLDKKSKELANKKIIKMDIEDDEKDMEKMLDECLEQMKDMISQQNH